VRDILVFSQRWAGRWQCGIRCHDAAAKAGAV